MSKKILLDIIKKMKLSILYSIAVFVVLFNYIDIFIFIYLVFVQIWLIYECYNVEQLQEANDRSAGMINKINLKMDELKEIYQDLVDGLGK